MTRRDTFKRYTLGDVVTQELRPTGNGYTVTNVMSDGTRRDAPAVATINQAWDRAREWFPQATTVVEIPEPLVAQGEELHRTWKSTLTDVEQARTDDQLHDALIAEGEVYDQLVEWIDRHHLTLSRLDPRMED